MGMNKLANYYYSLGSTSISEKRAFLTNTAAFNNPIDDLFDKLNFKDNWGKYALGLGLSATGYGLYKYLNGDKDEPAKEPVTGFETTKKIPKEVLDKIKEKPLTSRSGKVDGDKPLSVILNNTNTIPYSQNTSYSNNDIKEIKDMLSKFRESEIEGVKDRLNKVNSDLAAIIASNQKNDSSSYGSTAFKYAPHAAAAAALLAAGALYGRSTAKDNRRKK